MSGYNIDIADMQCWVFRMAQSKWKMSHSDCSEYVSYTHLSAVCSPLVSDWSLNMK